MRPTMASGSGPSGLAVGDRLAAARFGPRAGSTRVRIGAKLLATADGRALLIREVRPDGSTFWSLPGGGLRPGESPRAGLRREVAEELGCGVRLHGAVANCAYRHRSDPGTTTVYAVLHGSLVGEPAPVATEGVLECDWTAPPLPAGTLGPFRTLLRAVLG